MNYIASIAQVGKKIIRLEIMVVKIVIIKATRIKIMETRVEIVTGIVITITEDVMDKKERYSRRGSNDNQDSGGFSSFFGGFNNKNGGFASDFNEILVTQPKRGMNFVFKT